MRPLLAAAALSALLACGGTLYTAEGLPPLASGDCVAPQRQCSQGCFLPSAPDACGSSCAVCSAPAGGTRACVPAGGDFACDYTCSDGLLKCPAGCCKAAALAAGGDHTCAIASTSGTPPGALRCWGSNASGESTGIAGPTAVAIPFGLADAGVTAVAAGDSHTCAAVSGSVRCWGAGPGATVPAPGPAGVTALAAGLGHTCALAGGAVICWGANEMGQATPPAGLGAASRIAAGARHTCAGLSDGSVRCWGAVDRAQTGGGNPIPTGGADLLATGRDHTCAALSSGTDLLCWGDNTDGQLPLLGNPVSPPRAPLRTGGGGGRAITNGNAVRAMAAGGAHTCVVIDSPGSPEHGLSCFGDNAFGQLGQSFGGELLTVGAGTVGTTVLAAGASHTCAVFPADGLLRCWGRNQAGQLGDGDTATPPVGTLLKITGR